MKQNMKKTIRMFTVSALLILLPFALLVFIKAEMNMFYDKYAWLCFTVMVICWISALVILLKNYKRMVTVEMLEGMKSLIQSDREYFEYTGMQTNPYAYMIFLESNLIRDKYKIDRYGKIDNIDINLIATKKSEMALKRTLLRSVITIEADKMTRAEMRETVTKICDFFNGTRNEEFRADRRAVAVLFVGRQIAQNAKTYTKKIRTIKNGALIPVCVDLTESKIYFLCGKMVKQSTEEIAQKLVVRYVLGDRMERIPRNDGTQPMSRVQEKAIKDIDRMMELNLKRERANKEKKKSDKTIFKALQDGEFKVIEDVESVTVYYKAKNKLVMHVYGVDDYENKILNESEYNLLQVYPKYESVYGDEGDSMVKLIRDNVKSLGYSFNVDEYDESSDDDGTN